MFGSGYVIEHCIAAINADRIDSIYRSYVSDCLQAIAKCWGVQVSKRYADIIKPAQKDNRTAQEVVDDITMRAGLKVIKKHERIKPDGDAGA